VNTPVGLKSAIAQWLDDDKAEDIEIIDLQGESALADFMIIASGRSSRQVTAMASKLKDRLSTRGIKNIKTEGETGGDWVIVDCGDVIVHLFRPEVRTFYNIEQMWKMNAPMAVVSENGVRA
jgi:ribosome-associated protein